MYVFIIMNNSPKFTIILIKGPVVRIEKFSSPSSRNISQNNPFFLLQREGVLSNHLDPMFAIDSGTTKVTNRKKALQGLKIIK